MFFQKIILFLIFLHTGETSYSQIQVYPVVKCSLPSKLSESSGLFIQSADTLWSHNDSGNNAKLYAFDTMGNELMTRSMGGVSDKDWEEITKDNKGHIYIGDFGNNNNDRNDLVILRVSSDISDKSKPVVIDSISFQYEDQVFFPPPSSSLNFDCEAMVVMNDTIFLFTKDRTEPYLSQTLLYTLPASPGFHIAHYKSTYLTNVPVFLQGSITGAALSPDKKTLALLAYPRMWVFKNFKGTDFFSGKVSVLQFDSYSQKEGIAFIDNCKVYISDEINPVLLNGGNLYELNLCEYITDTKEIKSVNKLMAFYDRSTNSVQIKYDPRVNVQDIFITNMNAEKLIFQKEQSGIDMIICKLSYQIPAGVYLCSFYNKSNNLVQTVKFLVN
ncbi:MAG TPA: hypothetical protein VK590_04060 [Saprospiraceae bacterium]|nr:hypothetical protein [Saprospiraceae bacterium]